MSAGTIVCAVNETTGAAEALGAASRLSERLGMRLVTVHVVEDVPVSAAARREARAGGMRLVDRVLAEQRLAVADRRVAMGDPAAQIGRIAGEEGAALVVVGSKPGDRRPRPQLRSRLATELPALTDAPVVVVPPRPGGQLPTRVSRMRDPATTTEGPHAALRHRVLE
jgi:nucleotide-binding universal stress UspA family protein